MTTSTPDLASLPLPVMVVPGVFTCTIPNQKASYCPGDVFDWVITASSNTSFSDPKLGATLITCSIKGSMFSDINEKRPFAGPFSTVDYCGPSLPGGNLQSYINNGGKGSFTIPGANYVGFAQEVVHHVYYANDAGANPFAMNGVTCPGFRVSRNCPSTSSTTYPTTTATGTVVATSTVILNSAIAHSASAAFVVALALVL